jgi:hypothetical protein
MRCWCSARDGGSAQENGDGLIKNGRGLEDEITILKEVTVQAECGDTGSMYCEKQVSMVVHALLGKKKLQQR